MDTNAVVENLKNNPIDFSTLVDKFINWLSTNGVKLIIGALLLYIGWKIVNRLLKTFNKVLDKRGVDKTLVSFLNSFSNIAIKFILVLSVLDFAGFKTASLTALLASGGLAIGLALQGSLGNFAGGIIILFLRPFKVGDFIETSSHTGTVEDIKLFYTHLITPDNKQILIPNGTISNGSLINYSAKETRRVDLTFGVSYDADINHVKRVISNIINRHELIISDPEPFVGVTQHADSSVNFVVRVWCKTSDYWTVHFDLLEQVKVKFDEEKITIPYPQMDVRVKQVD